MELNNADCCFDGGDCEVVYGNCPLDNKRLGDGYCDVDLALHPRFCIILITRGILL